MLTLFFVIAAILIIWLLFLMVVFLTAETIETVFGIDLREWVRNVRKTP